MGEKVTTNSVTPGSGSPAFTRSYKEVYHRACAVETDVMQAFSQEVKEK